MPAGLPRLDRDRDAEMLPATRIPRLEVAVAFCLSSLELLGRTASFQASVIGRSRRSDHLNPGENLTPRTHHAETDHQGEHDGICDHVAPFAVYRLVMSLAQSHQADPRDIHSDNRAAGERDQRRSLGDHRCLAHCEILTQHRKARDMLASDEQAGKTTIWPDPSAKPTTLPVRRSPAARP